LVRTAALSTKTLGDRELHGHPCRRRVIRLLVQAPADVTADHGAALRGTLPLPREQLFRARDWLLAGAPSGLRLNRCSFDVAVFESIVDADECDIDLNEVDINTDQFVVNTNQFVVITDQFVVNTDQFVVITDQFVKNTD